MPAALTSLLLEIKGQSISPLVDDPGFGLAYQALSGSPASADVHDLANFVGSSLSVAPVGATHAPTFYWGPTVSRASGAVSIRTYDISNHLDGSPHGSPWETQTFTAATFTGTPNYAEGVCAVITLQGFYGSDVEFAPGARPRARDRGRVYFGPLNANALGVEATTNRTTLISGLANDLNKWIKAINQHITSGGTTYFLGVWSRKNARIGGLQQCYLDDRPDYQRRRADQSSVRYIQALP